MFKLSLLTLLLSLFSFAGDEKDYLDIQKFFEISESKEMINEAGIAYQYILPKYEENQPEDKELSIELYHAEFDGSEESMRKLLWIKEQIEEEKRLDPQLQLEIVATGTADIDIEKSERVQQIINKFQTSKIKYETIGLKQAERSPGSVGSKVIAHIRDPRIYWTYIRGASSFAATFGGLYIAEGLSMGAAGFASVLPAIASGAVTYHTGVYGDFLTNGKWSKWLMESETFFAKNIRKGFGLNEKSFSKYLVKNEKLFQKKYPGMYSRNKDIFKMKAIELAKESVANNPGRLKGLLTKLHSIEEYLKWYVTEVAFVGVAFKIPQAMVGVGASSTLLGSIGDVFAGSAVGMLAQGPGDIAIQKRKYQKLDELRLKVISGEVDNIVKEVEFTEKITENGKKVKVKTKIKVTLLEEIDMVLASSGKFERYTIHSASHQALNKIENWARSRATALSFLSVGAVGLELAGAQAISRPLLLAISAGGGVYFAHVKGWTKLSNIKSALKKFKIPSINFKLTGIFNRFCQSKFKLNI